LNKKVSGEVNSELFNRLYYLSENDKKYEIANEIKKQIFLFIWERIRKLLI